MSVEMFEVPASEPVTRAARGERRARGPRSLHLGWRTTPGRALLGVVAVVLALMAVPTTAGAAQTISQAVTVVAPTDAAANPSAYFVGVSCLSAGNCTAVGRYTDTMNRPRPFVGVQTSGVWARGTGATLPSDAGSGPANFNGVSCTSVGNCVAVGEYRDVNNARQALVATEVDGTWVRAAKLNLPTGATGGAVLTGVACTSVGNCVTAGNYNDRSGYQQAMVATAAGGAWGQASLVPAPAGASTNARGFLGPVSCTSVGNCVAVGDYVDKSEAMQAMAATMSGGVWGPAVQVVAPSDSAAVANVALLGVSCPSVGNCSAAGYYAATAGNWQPVTADMVDGTWARAARVAPPADARTTAPRGYFSGRSANVSCWSVGNCIAVGGYYDANGFQNMTATRTNGVWAPAVKSDVPSDAGTPNPDAGFSAVSCVTGGSCTAVGDYGNTSGYYNAQAADVLNDATPPRITHTVTPNAPDGSAGWYRGTPSVTFDVTDPESPATPEGTSCKARIIDTDGADQSFTCTATSLGGTTSDTVTINRDSTAPTVSFDNGGIADGGSYVWGSTPAAPTCSASDATSGVDGTCTVTGYDTTVGPQKLAATATDKAGNTTTITRSYTVTPWTTSGFFAPVDMGGVLNTVKGGATVPVKFKVTAGSTPVTDPATVGAFSATKVTCATGLPTDAIETTTTTGGTTLRYDATAGQFIYNWQTPKTTAGTCYKLTLTTPDSTPTSALFQLK